MTFSWAGKDVDEGVEGMPKVPAQHSVDVWSLVHKGLQSGGCESRMLLARDTRAPPASCRPCGMNAPIRLQAGGLGPRPPPSKAHSKPHLPHPLAGTQSLGLYVGLAGQPGPWVEHGKSTGSGCWEHNQFMLLPKA